MGKNVQEVIAGRVAGWARRSGFLRAVGAWLLRHPLRLFLIPLSSVTVIVALVVWQMDRSARALIEAQAAEQLASDAEVATRLVDQALSGSLVLAQCNARRDRMQAGVAAHDVSAVESVLRATLESGDDLMMRAFVTDPDGTEWVDWPPLEGGRGRNFAQRDWYRAVHRIGEPLVSGLYVRAAEPRVPVIAIAVPVRGDTGTVLGYLVAQIPESRVAKLLHTAHADPAVEFQFLDGAGMTVAPGTAEVRPGGMEWRRLLAGPRWLRGADGESAVLAAAAKGDKRGFHVVATRSRQSIFLGYGKVRAAAGVVLGLALLSALFGASAFTAAIHQHRVAEAAKAEARDDQTYMIVHDLRGPLAGLQAHLDLMAMDADAASAETAADIEAARRAGRRLYTMIDTMLQVRKLEDGQIVIQRGPADAAQWARQLVAELGPVAAMQGVTLYGPEEDAVLACQADRVVAERILENLLINGIKHTPAGGSVRVDLRQHGVGGLCMTVEDTGEGLPPDQIGRLFEKYGRLAGQKMSRRNDTGLGLVYCRLAAEAHGGGIRAENGGARGARFVVTLP